MSVKIENMIGIENAKAYTIAPGQNNFRPLESPLPRCASGFELAARFSPSCWWPETPENRKQRERWMKLKGFTHFFGRNNYRSVMIAFRPGKLEGVMEVTAYTNDKKGGWITTGNPVQVQADEVFLASCNLHGREAHYAISSFGRTTLYTHPWDTHWLKVYREIGTWINDPGAPQAMELDIDFLMIK